MHRKHVPTKSNVGSTTKTMMKRVPKSNFSKPKRTQTSKPITKEEACTFSLTIFLSKADNFWYLSVLDSTDSRCTGGTIGHHHGHARVSPDLIISKSTRIVHDNLALLGHSKQSGMLCAATAKLLTDRSNDRITAAQVNYRLQKKLTHVASSADEMIADFEKQYNHGYCTLSSSNIVFRNMLCNRGDVSWILVTHSKDAGLVIVNKPSGRPKKGARCLNLNFSTAAKLIRTKS